MAEGADLFLEDRIFGQQPVKIVLADREKLGVGLGANGGGARTAAQQRHFAKRLPVAELGACALVAVGQHFDGAVSDDIEGVAGIAGTEHDRVGFDLALLDAVDQRLDLLGRQVAQQSAFRQQRELFVDGSALAVQGIFQEARQ